MYVFLPTRRQRGRVWQLKLAASLRDVEHNRGLRRVQRPPGFTQLRFKIKSDCPQIRGAESRPLRAGTALLPERTQQIPVSRRTDWLTRPDHHTPQTSASFAASWTSKKKNQTKPLHCRLLSSVFPLCECALSWSAVSVSCLGCSPASTVWSKYGDRS